MSRFLHPLLTSFCIVMVASVTISARPADKRARYKPDISVSEVKRLVRDDVARWQEFKGNNFYEGGDTVPAQNIILPGGRKVTERYLVMIENDGTKTSEMSIELDIPEDVVAVEKGSAGATFFVTIYTATGKGKKILRGDNVTADFTADGIVVAMEAGERRFYWVEIQGLKGFRKRNEYVAVPMRARSLKGTQEEDYFFITFGAGETLIPDDGGGDNVDAIDHKTVNWSAAPMNVGPWEVAATLTSVTQSKYLLCMDSTKKNSWPKGVTPGKGVTVNANMWAIAQKGGIWYAGIIEWMVPGGVCKPLGSGPGGPTLLQAMATHWFFPPLKGHVPKSGDTLYVFLSALAWPGMLGPFPNAMERTNIVKIVVR